MWRLGVPAVGVAMLAVGAARADDDPTHRFPSTAAHTAERAGNPQAVAWWAVPSRSPYHAGGYVGGGRLLVPSRKPDGRELTTDGTWGWDYVGFGRRPGRVFLDWWHDRPKQPQPGPYATDGRHPPDVVALHPIKKAVEAVKPGHKD